MEIVKGDIFIVPNGLSMANSKVGVFNANGMEEAYEGLIVEVWMTGSGSENWGSHSFPEPIANVAGEGAGIDGRWRYLAPHYLPVNVFAGKVEGDCITLNFYGVQTELVLAQSKYRYRNFGKFEEVLNMLLRKYNERMLEAA